ncbi:MAG: phosphoribosyltransferase [Aphanocapsa sp. GSE-SYN-MK-11-07L]|jgi:putative phosphoribosyl transferase|nr:phosphoribosyltransferase [Aphanocapsa sp. GSE-SYN-MK-11-07L]
MHEYSQKFSNRQIAGLELGTKLKKYGDRPDVVVLGLPRGGVPVAFEIAKALKAPLDICLVRKLGVPGHPELAMGAIAAGGVRILNQDLVNELAISQPAIHEVTTREWQELQRRDRVYRDDRPQPEIQGRTVILVDDGLATGSTMQAAIAVVKSEQAAQIVVAVPVAPLEACNELKLKVDEVVCLLMPKPFYAIGLWYEDFSQTTDREVKAFLSQQFAASRQPK